MPTAKSKGLTVNTFKGLNDKRMKKNDNANFGLRLSIKQGDTVPVQFLYGPDEFTEFDQHSWSDGGRWYFVPCAGDECPICQDEDRKRAKRNYRFAALVYNLAEKKVQILEGPKDLAGRIAYRYKRKPGLFLKRTFEVTKFPTTPVTYDFVVGDDDLVSSAVLKTKAKGVISIEDYLEGELKSFYGSDMPQADLSSKVKDERDDDDEDDETEEVEYTLAELKKMKIAKLQEIAEDLEIDIDEMDKSDLIDAIVAASSEDEDEDEDDEDDDEEDDDTDEDEDDDSDDDDEEDDDDDEDDDEDEDDEDDVPVKKSSAKKSVAKKTPAKKVSAAKKTATRRR